MADGPVFVLGWPMGRDLLKVCVKSLISSRYSHLFNFRNQFFILFLSLSSIKYLAPEVEEEIKGKSFWVYFVGFMVFMAFQYRG